MNKKKYKKTHHFPSGFTFDGEFPEKVKNREEKMLKMKSKDMERQAKDEDNEDINETK